MALYRLIHKRSWPILPLAFRAIGSLQTALATPVNIHESPRTPIPSHNYSSVASSLVAKRKSDEKLVCLINSQIKSLKHIPKAFPFQVCSYAPDGMLELKKEDRDESIKVEIVMSSLNSVVHGNRCEIIDEDTSDDSEDDRKDDGKGSRSKDTIDEDSLNDQSDDSADDSNNEEGDESAFPMVVRVTKGDGVFLEFDVNASPYNISIVNLSLKSDDDCGGPILHFSELESGLKHALHKYLQIRGINTRLVEFLHEYAMKQSRDEELAWLKKLKIFIKN